MVGTWPAFASSFTDDDPLLFLPSDDADDDPSSYLLYPPGFGPVEDWLIDPAAQQDSGISMLGGDSEGYSGQRGGAEEATADVMGLSEALSGKITLGEDSEFSGGADIGRKDGVPEYVTTGCLGVAGDGGGDVLAPVPAPPRVKVEESDVVPEGPVSCTGANADGGVKKEVNSESDDSSESKADESDADAENSSSSSSPSSEETSEEEDDSEDEDEDGEDNDNDDVRKKTTNGLADLEDGEIGNPDIAEPAMSSDDEDGITKGPIKSKNEVEDLPLVPPVSAALEPHHQTFPVGSVSSIVGCRVIVEGVEKHSPLTEGSVLWVAPTRLPLGIVDEIFGPVKNPYYVVRFNSAAEIPAAVAVGTEVCFAAEFAGHVLDLSSLYKKGYDASGENDEELNEEAEFSDDDKEAEYRRSLRQAKGGGAGPATYRQRNFQPPTHNNKKAHFDRPPPSNNRKTHFDPPPSSSIRKTHFDPPLPSSNRKTHFDPPPPPHAQGQMPAAPPPPPHAQGQMPAAPPPPPLQMAAMPRQFTMGQLQMPPPMPGMAYGGQNFFPNPFWPHGIAAFQAMLPNQQMGFVNGQAFQAFPFPFSATNQGLPPPIAPWQGAMAAPPPPAGNEGFSQAAPPRPAEPPRTGNGGSQRPFMRGRRPFVRGGFRGRGRGGG